MVRLFTLIERLIADCLQITRAFLDMVKTYDAAESFYKTFFTIITIQLREIFWW